jgi:hypothetical protein
MFGWLFQVLTGDGLWGLKHCISTLTMVPITFVSKKGFPNLHVGQILNRSSSWERKIMKFGSIRTFSELLDTLQQ